MRSLIDLSSVKGVGNVCVKIAISLPSRFIT